MQEVVEIIKVLITGFLLPVAVSLACFYVQNKKQSLDAKKNKVPTVFTLHLERKGKVQQHEKRIRNCGLIIEFQYREYPDIDAAAASDPGKAIDFKTITFEEFLGEVEEQSMFFIGFGNLVEEGLGLQYLVDKDERFWKIDSDKVPVHVLKDYGCCLVCKDQYIPKGLQGTFLRNQVSYYIEGMEDDNISPKMKQEKRKFGFKVRKF